MLLSSMPWQQFFYVFIPNILDELALVLEKPVNKFRQTMARHPHLRGASSFSLVDRQVQHSAAKLKRTKTFNGMVRARSKKTIRSSSR